MNLSDRLFHVPASPIRKLVPYATEAKQKGVTVYHLNIGDPDIKTPDVMLQQVTQWNKNPIGYAQSKGEPKLLQAMQKYYQQLGFQQITDADIQITVGGSEAIGMTLFAICNPGDEVLVFEPFYANYLSYASLYNIRLIPVPTSPENGFHLPNKEEIVSYISSKTKGILLCNPNNPTGTVYAADELDLIVGIAEEYSLFVLSDEVYREFVYDGKTAVSILTYVNRIPDQVVLLDSLSKRYSACGIRIGAIVSKNTALMDGVLRIAQGRLSAGLIDQEVAAAMINVPGSYTTAVQQEYEQRRNIVYTQLCQISGVDVKIPEGAFYCMATLPIQDADHFCQWLLTDFRDHNETVMLAPGSGFYADKSKGKNQIRIAYVLETNTLKRAVELLQIALTQYTADSR